MVSTQTNTRHAQPPQGMCGAETDQHSTRSQPPQGMWGSDTANTRYALNLHRVCVVPRQPTLDTLTTSTGYVWFQYSQHSTRSQPPQGMCGIETANTRQALSLLRVCEVPRPPPNLDTLSASTGYVWCRDSQHSTRTQLPQGMCGSETANTRHALSLHRVCVVPRQPTLDTLSASTGSVWFRDSQHSIRSQPPQGLCGSETANTRHALSLHRVCAMLRQPTLDTLSASTGYVWFRDSQHSIRAQHPQGM